MKSEKGAKSPKSSVPNRTLAELMAKQYFVKNLLGLDKINLLDFHGMGKKHSCLCLSYLSFEAYPFVWISKPFGNLVFKQIPLTADGSQDLFTTKESRFP